MGFAPATSQLKSLPRLSERLDVTRAVLGLNFGDLNPLQPKHAFSALDRVSLFPTAGSWAARVAPPVSVALAGLWVSAPEKRASAHRYFAGYDFPALTFDFSFADSSAVGNWWIVAIVLTLIQALKQGKPRGSLCSTERGTGRASPCSECRVAPAIQLELLLEHFLDLADLFFNFAGPMFGFAFGL